MRIFGDAYIHLTPGHSQDFPLLLPVHQPENQPAATTVSGTSHCMVLTLSVCSNEFDGAKEL